LILEGLSLCDAISGASSSLNAAEASNRSAAKHLAWLLSCHARLDQILAVTLTTVLDGSPERLQ